MNIAEQTRLRHFRFHMEAMRAFWRKRTKRAVRRMRRLYNSKPYTVEQLQDTGLTWNCNRM